MRTLKFKLLIPACILILLSSCMPYFYVPTPLNMPLPGKKNELKASVDASSTGFGLQASYALDSQFLVMGSFYRNPFSKNLYSNGLGGLGFFTHFDTYGRLEVIFGAGGGSANTAGQFNGSIFDPKTTVANINGGFAQFFGQFDFGWVYDDFDIGLGLRLSNISTYGNYASTTTTIGFTSPIVDHYNLALEGNAFLIEPGLMMAVGFHDLKWNLNMGFSLKTSGTDVNTDHGTIYQFFYAGTGFTLNLFRKKKNNPESL